MRGLPRLLMDDATRCLGRAGDCAGAPEATRRAAVLVDADEKKQHFASGQRVMEMFVSITRAECAAQPIRRLTPREVMGRSAATLDLPAGELSLDAAGDCGAAFRAHLDGYELNPRDVPMPRRVAAFDRWRARTCWRKRIDGLAREPQVLWLAELLDHRPGAWATRPRDGTRACGG